MKTRFRDSHPESIGRVGLHANLATRGSFVRFECAPAFKV